MGGKGYKMEEREVMVVIATLGWVFVGWADVSDTWVHLDGAWNVRRWGTPQGLGQLHNGPLPETILDAVGEIRLPMSSVIGLIKCNSLAWALNPGRCKC